jgi:CubicO group peptidase (beta-lactamase class C family)
MLRGWRRGLQAMGGLVTSNAMNRREMMTAAAATVAAGFAGFSGLARAAAPSPLPSPERGAAGAVPPALNSFIADYMAAMNAPALTLALSDRRVTLATAAYGITDLTARTPLNTRQLFEIGSITKSFAALVILQLQDEGKLDVQHPITRYLPWLPIETDYGEIRIHHLLTHSSGMPDDPPIWPGEDGARARQAFKPGTQFHYSNWGFDVLGHLIESLDGTSWPAAVTRRIFAPLGMTDTAAAIDSAAAPRIAASFLPMQDDRPYPRHGALTAAGPLTFAKASGSIAAPPADMARYMRLLLNGGVGPTGRLVSEAGFMAMTTPYVAAEEFGPGASYGYGIAIDELDGHKRLRHTGGMVSFMSAMHLDLDTGVGAFASVNAQLGYRPNPVAQYALQLLRAAAEHKRAPPVPAADPAAATVDAGAYTGVFTAPNGKSVQIAGDGHRLAITVDGVRIALEHMAGDQFLADHPRFALYPLVFGRESASAPVSELAYGEEWYLRQGYKAPAVTAAAPQLAAYAGLYHSDDPWIGSARIVVRRGRLWIDGTLPLDPIGADLFRYADEPSSPETAEFRGIAAGRAQILITDGGVLRRVSDV